MPNGGENVFYSGELEYMKKVFDRLRLRSGEISTGSYLDEMFDRSALLHSEKETVAGFLGEIKPQTVYKLKDSFALSYIYFLLPMQSQQLLFFVGPYINSFFSDERLLEIGEKNRIHPKNQKALERYLRGVPVIGETDSVFTMIDLFCERVFGFSAYTVVDKSYDESYFPSPLHNEKYDDSLLNMDIMERRYSYENEMMEAVSLGHIHKETQFLPAFADSFFERRTADPLRNIKNYCIIMNTLLRKAAERGGVHPVYLDRVSSDFAVSIELFQSKKDAESGMRDMFRSYCRLVRKHSTKDYSPIVQKVILKIDSDLSSELSLSILAEQHSVSPGYLSGIFKKETGKSLTDYIREKRMKRAAHLLETTKLQIQTVALHCGIMDVQYFSKMFKKVMGKSPSEYRENVKSIK